MKSPARIGRRRFLAAAGAGAALTFGFPGLAGASEWNETEKANARIVSDMCAAWTAPIDFDKIGGYLAEDCSFRLSETAAPIKGRQAIIEALRKTLGAAQKVSFEIVQTFARGPMVVNERIDLFTLPTRSIDWNGVGVFFLQNGLIQEWSDYTVRRR